MVNPSVTLTKLSVQRRGKAILGHLDLTLEGRGTTIVLGPNGAGKTTLLKVLNGVERISSGQISWNVSDKQAREMQAYVFQRPTMLRRSVGQNLAYPLELLGCPKAQIAQDVQYWAAKLGLTEMLDYPAPRLSGGEKQKLALARALIRGPKVLFLDEPCANLDGRATREIEQVLREAQAAGTRIIMTTHDLGQARRLANDVVFLLNGRVHEQGSAPRIFQTPQEVETKAFLEGDIVE